MSWLYQPYNVPSGLQSFSYTATGGIVFAGTSPQLKLAIFAGVGGIVFSGNPPRIKRLVPPNPTGGLVFLGVATVQAFFKLTYSAVGGIIFSGAATKLKIDQVPAPSGGLDFDGGALVGFKGVIVPSGGVVFGGSAPVSFFSVSPPANPIGRLFFGFHGQRRRLRI